MGKLTDEQEAEGVKRAADEAIEVMVATESVDFDKAKYYIREMYVYYKLKPPKEHILAKSPIQDAKMFDSWPEVKSRSTIHLDSMDVETDGPGAPMTISLAGNINGGSFQASGRLGPLETLFKGGAPYPVSLDLSAPGVNVTLAGPIADPGKAKGTDFQLVLGGSAVGEAWTAGDCRSARGAGASADLLGTVRRRRRSLICPPTRRGRFRPAAWR